MRHWQTPQPARSASVFRLRSAKSRTGAINEPLDNVGNVLVASLLPVLSCAGEITTKSRNADPCDCMRQYVKDLEISHHNLRHLVTHQGGEIESLKSRLIDLSGGKEGTEPSLPLSKLPLLSKPDFKAGSDSASPCDSMSSDNGSPRSIEDPEEPTSPSSSFKRSHLPLPMMEQQHVTLAHEPLVLQNLAPPPASEVQQPFGASTLPLPINIPNAQASGGHDVPPQFWPAPSSVPVGVPSPRTLSTSSASTASSFTSSVLYTPPTPSSMMEPMGHGQPFLAVEASPHASYHTWQADAPGHVNDFSHWLQQSMQASQYCLPFQESENYASLVGQNSYSDPMKRSVYNTFTGGGWPAHTHTNALGLENLFPNLNPGGKTESATDSLHLLGRPLTPFPSLASPSAEYAFAT